jgi:threonine/homoserine/homoserine lactone efflux protein
MQQVFGIHDYWLFVATGVLLNLTPGQDTMFILGRSLTGGLRAGVASALGISVGCLVHTFVAAIGLSAVLAASTTAFIAIKVLGAAYLVYLGARLLLARPRDTVTMEVDSADQPGAWSAFRQGILTNVLNPKVALFFFALLPQFIAPDSTSKTLAFLALGATFITTGTLWCLVLAVGAARLRTSFTRSPALRAALDRIVGTIFVVLGIRLALDR